MMLLITFALIIAFRNDLSKIDMAYIILLGIGFQYLGECISNKK